MTNIGNNTDEIWAKVTNSISGGLVIILCIFFALSVSKPADAAIITVNTTEDEHNVDGDCALREAVISANTDTAIDACTAGSGADEIMLDPSVVPGTFGRNISISSGLNITDDLTISGAGAANTIIDGGKEERVFHVIGTIQVKLSGLTIQNGRSGGLAGGGGIRNSGGMLTVTHCVVSDNETSGQESGGGIQNAGGTLTITHSLITNNSAGDNGGGGIEQSAGGSLIISHSTISNNNTSINGGGMDIQSGTVHIINSSIYGNRAENGGGGISSEDTLTMVNTTVVGNWAGDDGGGISSEGEFTITNSTVVGNDAEEGGGIRSSSSTVQLVNTILALNTNSDCDGRRFTSLGNNLFGDTSECDIVLLPSDLTGNPGLDSFSDDGTPGNGHLPLLADSQAIDAGNNDVCPEADQIGGPRPVDGDGDRIATCDIGAIEFQTVHIDIKPGNKRNVINPRSKGGVWVAILSDSEFDPLQIDITTVRFGPDEANAIRSRVKDVNRDGLGDLLLRFKIPLTGIACGDTEANLIGETFGGQDITSTDSIKTVGCKP